MELFDIEDKVILITGGGGALGSAMAGHLAQHGAVVILLNHRQESLDTSLANLQSSGNKVYGYVCDVTDEAIVREVSNKIVNRFHRIDVLINAAGGNRPGATIGIDQSVFDMNVSEFKKVVDLNLFGSVIPSLVFGEEIVKQRGGTIINISSMAAQRAITRVLGYSVAKAGIDMFTKWLAVEMAKKHGDSIRVNAVAPGFFIGKQNRDLLLNKDGTYTERGKTIIRNTPMDRFGDLEELNGTIHYLCSEASRFVSGAVIPVDGGFDAFSGV